MLKGVITLPILMQTPPKQASMMVDLLVVKVPFIDNAMQY